MIGMFAYSVCVYVNKWIYASFKVKYIYASDLKCLQKTNIYFWSDVDYLNWGECVRVFLSVCYILYVNCLCTGFNIWSRHWHHKNSTKNSLFRGWYNTLLEVKQKMMVYTRKYLIFFYEYEIMRELLCWMYKGKNG